MGKASHPPSSDPARRLTPGRPGRKGGQAGRLRQTSLLSPDASAEGGSRVDDVGFAIFAGYLVLAFTTAFPDQFALPKLLGLYVYAAFAAARWIPAVKQGRVQALPRGLALTTVALAGWWTAATLTAQHVSTAFFGMRGRYNGLATMLAGLALFFFIATKRATERQVERWLGAICVALTMASGYALAQAAGLDPIPWPEGRPASTMGHPVIFGGALAMALPFGLAFALDARSRMARLAWGGATLAQGLALTLTLARGPWIGAVCGLMVLAILAASHRRALAPRAAVLGFCAVLLVSTVLAVSTPARSAVLGRVSTITSLSHDSSLLYRLHFCRAALAMLRDRPLIGVGWENFGLLYPRYRSAPTESIAPDLVPTMVHSGPLQTAVSAGLPALALHLLFFACVAIFVTRRWRREPGGRQRLVGSAFLASATAYLVQDLSGWPHVAFGALAFVVSGLGVSWSLEHQPRPLAASRLPLAVLAGAIGIGSAWMALDTWRRIRADRLMFEAQQLDVRSSWSSVEWKFEKALDLSPDKAWANSAAAQLCLRRTAAAGDRRAYERGVELANAASAANPFDPYIRLRRTELDIVAIDRGLLARVTDEGRDSLAAAKSMAADSARVQKNEESLSRKARHSRIISIQPQATAGFGPGGSLVVTGSSPKALAGTHVFLHWRNVTRKSAWTVAPHAPVPDPGGGWHNSIPNANFSETYEVYSTSETWSYGPCTYPGNGSIKLCSPLSLVGPDTSGVGPPGSIIVAGALPEAWAGAQVFLHWRNATRRSAWTRRPFFSEKGVSFPADAPGNWYSILPDSSSAEAYEVYLSSPTGAHEPCAYTGDGSHKLCSPIAWIQPQAMVGFGPPGGLVVAGFAPEAWAGTPVFLRWRNATWKSAWTTEAYAPVPDGRGTWYNAIPNANPSERYEVYITSPTTASGTCTYAGDGAPTFCP